MKVLSALLLLVAALCIASAQGKRCGTNEIWNECGTACPASCERPGPRVCTFNCVSQCECADGFIRRTRDNQCVRPQQCGRYKRATYP